MPIQPSGERREILRLDRLRVWVLLIAVCSCAAPVTAPAQMSGSVYPPSNQPATQPPAEKFTVTGTVIDAVSGEPVRKALVQLNVVPRRTAFTDSGGRFQFEG
ncbi:MAG TPA: carboxypeptidase-like regulatory domain-containing protein, partial [Terriglobales bacterium]